MAQRQAMALRRQAAAKQASAGARAQVQHLDLRSAQGERPAYDLSLIHIYAPLLVATGPLTEGALAEAVAALSGGEELNFYDAVAPIVTAESLDYNKVFAASRYGRGEADYLNCPFNKEEYETFHAALISAERAPRHDADKDLTVYEGCMPIEVMAARGADTIRFGPLRPVGLKDPNTGHRPWANVQLRKENTAGTLYNLVGFQTNLKWGEQQRVFRMIPGLENAEFVRYGCLLYTSRCV